MKIIENIFCIHSSMHEKRKENTEREFHKYFPETQLHFVEAIMNAGNPARGCGESFCKCIEENQDKEYILICEDDVEFVKGARKKIMDALQPCNIPEKADIILGGSYNLPSRKEVVSSHYLRVGDYASHHFVLFFKSAYEKVLRYKTQRTFSNLDRYIGQTFAQSGELNVYVIHPMPVRQRDGFSTILKKKTQYNTIEWAREHCLLWYNAEIHGLFSEYVRCNTYSYGQPLEAGIKTVGNVEEIMNKYKSFIELNHGGVQRTKLDTICIGGISLWDPLYWCVQIGLHEHICEKLFGCTLIDILRNTNEETSEYSITFS